MNEKKGEECSSSATSDDGCGELPNVVREKLEPLFSFALSSSAK